MKKILITGASDGIGLEIAKLLAQEGNQLTLVARNKEKLERVVATLPGKVHRFLVADLSRKEDTHQVADQLASEHYDVLINNAGVGMYGRFDEMAMENLAPMMNLNMYSVTKLSLSFLQHAQKGDCLINMASTLGITSFPGLAVYAATKAYVSNFSDSLWWEYRRRGIYVLGFCPGATDTSFHGSEGAARSYFPSFVLQTPQQVAKELVRAMHRRTKPRAVAGATNRIMLFFQRLLPRKAVINMMGSFSPIGKA